jgi:imidazolonepropionase
MGALARLPYAPMATLVIRGIGELCACDRQRGAAPGVIRNAALVAHDGVLTFAGPEAELAAHMSHVQDAGEITELDAAGAAVIPGFVDSHTHLVWIGDRSEEYAMRAAGKTYEEIAAGGGGIRATVRATAAGTVDELTSAARARARRALRHGTTTIEVKSGYGFEVDAEMRQLYAANELRADPGVPDVVTTYLGLHAEPESNRDAYVDEVCSRGVSEAAQRATFVDAFCERGAFTVDECQRLFGAAAASGLRAKVHAEQLSHSGGARLAARVGAVSADHLEYASDDDLEALATAGVVGVILPGAALVLGGPPPPGRRLLDAGARVAVATDCNPGTCYSESMPLMVSLAVALAGLTPGQALVAATAGGAAALGLADRGVLRPGMRCDAVILNTPHWLDVGYHLGGDVVGQVIRDGRIVINRGEEE